VHQCCVSISYHFGNNITYLQKFEQTGLPTFKRSYDADHASLREQFVICRPELAMVNLHIKFDVSVFTHSEDTKGNAKFRNLGD